MNFFGAKDEPLCAPLQKGWVADFPQAEFLKASDEHGVIRINCAPGFALGDKIKLIPGHCDPTVNLYDHFVCVRGGKVEALWPITARGAVW